MSMFGMHYEKLCIRCKRHRPTLGGKVVNGRFTCAECRKEAKS